MVQAGYTAVNDCRFYGRKGRGPTLKAAYDAWVKDGNAAVVDAKKEKLLGWIEANVEVGVEVGGRGCG